MNTSKVHDVDDVIAPIDSNEDVELGAHVEARVRGIGVGAFVAVQVSRDLLARMNEYGRPRGMTVIDVLLQGVECVIGGTVDPPAIRTVVRVDLENREAGDRSLTYLGHVTEPDQEAPSNQHRVREQPWRVPPARRGLPWGRR
jgi:hypothetical protein